MASLPTVERVVRISEEYRIIGRHHDNERSLEFTCNGVTFSQNELHVFAGLCAVDNPEHVEMMMRALQEHGQAGLSTPGLLPDRDFARNRALFTSDEASFRVNF